MQSHNIIQKRPGFNKKITCHTENHKYIKQNEKTTNRCQHQDDIEVRIVSDYTHKLIHQATLKWSEFYFVCYTSKNHLKKVNSK